MTGSHLSSHLIKLFITQSLSRNRDPHFMISDCGSIECGLIAIRPSPDTDLARFVGWQSRVASIRLNGKINSTMEHTWLTHSLTSSWVFRTRCICQIQLLIHLELTISLSTYGCENPKITKLCLTSIVVDLHPCSDNRHMFIDTEDGSNLVADLYHSSLG